MLINVLLSSTGQLLVIVEFCAGGNLLQYLRRKRQDVLDPLTTVKQIEMGLQVSRGMAFLSTQKVCGDGEERIVVIFVINCLPLSLSLSASTGIWLLVIFYSITKEF